MTPEQKIIIIAEFEGWKVHPKDRFIVIPPNSPHSVQPLHTLPPYLTSRDAICGAVARLDALQGAWFVANLANVQGWKYQHKTTFQDSIFSLITATPAQLADALLLTLGKEI